MKKRAIVLGNGLVGSVIALDLAADEEYEVVVCDANAETLAETRKKSGGKIAVRSDVDFASPASITEAVRGFDICFGAVPGFLGYKMLGAVIKAGVGISDISFMPEDYREWDQEAKKAGVVAYEDIGVAPGATSVLIGHACSLLDTVDDAICYVGGLPTDPKPPFNYKVVFSADDVIEEYVRPARCKKNGEIVTVPALSNCEIIDFDIPGLKLPRMEGFFTDGSRTLLDTIPAQNVIEYTLRYPGTARDLELLRSIGLFDKEPVKIKGVDVSPRDLFGHLAYPMMKLGENENEFTFFQVNVTGAKDGKRIKHTFSLYDERDMKTGYPSMSRTTGFSCAIAGRMIAEGLLDSVGVNPPEHISKSKTATERLINELKKRGVKILQSQETL
ncbi:MAG: saccharopine dehydrogenase NADP-binding domain-containing protein [Synergistaceae bacterium]|jgi:saccharopine dehydrogenase-like NADP-dependent oxidoreductase|nr:saccharopine dehydrogenase NADP-binding domain-containing protein [Synergistaceae bacterium]